MQEKNNDTDPNKWDLIKRWEPKWLTDEEYWALPPVSLAPTCSTCGKCCSDMLLVNVCLSSIDRVYNDKEKSSSFSFCSHDCAKEGMGKVLINCSKEYGHDVTLRLKPVVE